jgi:sterol 14-demethylase
MSMRIVVDLDLCQGHGVCQTEAPEIFRVVDRPGEYGRVEVILERPPEELRGPAEAAAKYCPNRVIRIVED